MAEGEQLVGLKLTALYQSDANGLVPCEMPCILAAACSVCYAPSLEPPCQCGWSYCSRCTCSYCSPPAPQEYEDSPRELVAESSADTGATEQLVIMPTLYEQLRESRDPLQLKGGVFVKLMFPELGRCVIEDEIASRAFGSSVDDFKRLCRNLAWDYPGGLALINLDRQRTLVFAQETHYEPNVADLSSALAWIQTTPGTLGLLVRARGDVVDCTLFAVVFYEEHAQEHLAQRRDRVLNEVRSWR